MIKVVWSKRSLQELDDILEYWLNRNMSNSYPNKILKESSITVNLICTQPEIGVETDHRNVKMRLVLNRFYLVYRITKDEIEILKFWDCRQDPQSNKYSK